MVPRRSILILLSLTLSSAFAAAGLSAQLGSQQVVIEARIIEASTTFSKDLGVRWGLGAAANGIPILGRNGRAIATLGKTFDDSDWSTTNLNLGLQVDLPVSAAPSQDIRLLTIPKITPYGTFEFEIESSSYDVPSSSGPSVSERDTQTGVIVGGGARIAIGGLARPQDGAEDAKLPILGDIALVGRLFDHNTTAQVRVSVVILLKPAIIRSDER